MHADDAWWRRIEVDGGLVLRAMHADDAEGVFSVHGDKRVYVFDPHETHPDVAHSRTFIAPMLAHWDQHGFGYWTVLVPRDWWPDGVPGPAPGDDGLVHAGLGGVHTHTIGERPVLNVYFRLAHGLHGRGIAGSIIAQTVRMAVDVAPGVDVVVRTRPANAAARRVAERAGFTDEGLEPGTTDMQLLSLRP